MKIQILSDLHNEVRRRRGLSLDIAPTDADVIVLAGDIDAGSDGLRWAARERDRLRSEVVYVAGNHEFYHHDLDELLEELRRAARLEGVHFLERDEVWLQGVRFLGATLWTDYGVCPEFDRDLVFAACAAAVPDHQLVRRNHRPFTPEAALAVNQETVAWLDHALGAEEGPVVVVTHHGPSPACQHPGIPVNPVSAGFQSDFEHLLARADLWIYGHTHSCLDAIVAGTRLVSNQLGYPAEGPTGFDPAKTVEIRAARDR